MPQRMQGEEPRKVSRRRFLEISAYAGAAVIASACAAAPTATPATKPVAIPPTAAPPAATKAPVPAAPPTSAPAAFDWKKFAGTELYALFTVNDPGRLLKARIGDFEKLTGMKVNFDLIETATMRNKQNVEFAAGSSAIDVWHTYAPQEGLKYFRAGWYEPLQSWLDNKTLTAPDLDPNDFGALRLGKIRDTLIGLPMWTEVMPLYYNKEILEKAGVAVPKTMDELEAAAKKVHDPAKEIYGWATRATSYLNTSTMVPPFFSMGADWLDKDGRAALNSPQAIAALDWYGRMLRLYGPPSPDTVDVTRESDLFRTGKVAFALDSPSFLATYLDPARSQVVGKFDIAPWPAGPAGSRTSLGCWSACIGKYSKKKEAAWYLVQWLASKEMNLSLATAGQFPARTSVINSAAYKEIADKISKNVSVILQDGMKNGITQVFPPVEVAEEGRQLWGDAVVGAIQGKDVKTLAEEANKKFQAILDKEKK